MKYRIQVYQQSNGNAPYEEWVVSLDKTMQARVNARIARFEDGYFGDHKLLGDGVYEARFFIGPGYRVYFSLHKSDIILLLTGGDKSTQNKDVKKAKAFFKTYLEVKNANKKS